MQAPCHGMARKCHEMLCADSRAGRAWRVHRQPRVLNKPAMPTVLYDFRFPDIE